MADTEDSKSEQEESSKPKSRQPGAGSGSSAGSGGGTGKESITGPARLYGDEVPEPSSQSAPPTTHSKLGARPTPKPAAKPGDAASVKPAKKSVKGGNRTSADRTPKPKA